MSVLEVFLTCVVAYLMAGAMKVTQDFRASPMERPFYVSSRRPMVTLIVWVFWWRSESIQLVLMQMIACLVVVALVTWGIGFITSNIFIRYGRGRLKKRAPTGFEPLCR